ncbi:hypothetical protein MKW92_021940, partial [Papaver armeniacum]
ILIVLDCFFCFSSTSQLLMCEIGLSVKGLKTEFKGPPLIGHCILGPGFVNVTLPNKWIAKTIQSMLEKGIGIWAPKLRVSKAVVDFSSPNIAKEMHVGHPRSTIIGDTITRFFGVLK